MYINSVKISTLFIIFLKGNCQLKMSLDQLIKLDKNIFEEYSISILFKNFKEFIKKYIFKNT